MKSNRIKLLADITKDKAFVKKAQELEESSTTEEETSPQTQKMVDDLLAALSVDIAKELIPEDNLD